MAESTDATFSGEGRGGWGKEGGRGSCLSMLAIVDQHGTLIQVRIVIIQQDIH